MNALYAQALVLKNPWTSDRVSCLLRFIEKAAQVYPTREEPTESFARVAE
jgi:hypothetical protein